MILAFLRDPTRAASKVALGVATAAFASVGVGYVVIGLWFGLESPVGSISASFALGALFMSFTVGSLAPPDRMSREPTSTDDPR